MPVLKSPAGLGHRWYSPPPRFGLLAGGSANREKKPPFIFNSILKKKQNISTYEFLKSLIVCLINKKNRMAFYFFNMQYT